MRLDDFDAAEFDRGDARIFYRQRGNGPPLLLLHGYPQTHHAWHAVAPALAQRYALVVPDLPGYGRSAGPEPTPENYSKRAIAAMMVELMQRLGHRRFFVAGHDRGARVAYRMALDSPQHVARLAVLDIVPTLDMWERFGHRGAMRSYHWNFLAQPAPLPERLIGNDPDFYLMHLLRRWAADFSRLAPDAIERYRQAFAQPATIAATCADYRAGAGIDVEHDRADPTSGVAIGCPLLLIWARQYLSSQSPLQTWRRWADDVREVALDCGHFVAEERADECAAALDAFFAEPGRADGAAGSN